MSRNFAPVGAWSAISGVVWIVGGVLHGDARLIVWIVALLLDVSSPIHSFRLPRHPGTPMEEWPLAGAHLAERMQLVLIIALGESVLRVGATFAEEPGSFHVYLAFILGFLGTASLWAVYFLRHAEIGAEAVSHAAGDATRMARNAYTYAHAVM